MHLLDVRTWKLKKNVEERHGTAVEPYAILSHRWLAPEHEITFQDVEQGFLWSERIFTRRKGFYKFDQCCQQALRDGFNYVWIDTCCIDKSSSAELQENINSMYRYYENSQKCYLIAPRQVDFFDREWKFIGGKNDVLDTLSDITGIDRALFTQDRRLEMYPVAQRMSWASHRKATKDEDLAYSLLGLFDVNMPMLYGEGGSKAFLRLQEEIIKSSDDQSIFAWKDLKGPCGLLAWSPEAFHGCGNIERLYPHTSNGPFSTTNKGISITLDLIPRAIDTYTIGSRLSFRHLYQEV
ncbi:heterokaryon incompatibility protein-domain-containing protein [Rostrohypoxylon terebratum]|nr:heterokaryon incompatibility protein-domain-containing protein [Rostrohypoxylon terebratum]